MRVLTDVGEHAGRWGVRAQTAAVGATWRFAAARASSSFGAHPSAHDTELNVTMLMAQCHKHAPTKTTHLVDEARDGGDELQLGGHALQLLHSHIVQTLAVHHTAAAGKSGPKRGGGVLASKETHGPLGMRHTAAGAAAGEGRLQASGRAALYRLHPRSAPPESDLPATPACLQRAPVCMKKHRTPGLHPPDVEGPRGGALVLGHTLKQLLLKRHVRLEALRNYLGSEDGRG